MNPLIIPCSLSRWLRNNYNKSRTSFPCALFAKKVTHGTNEADLSEVHDMGLKVSPAYIGQSLVSSPEMVEEVIPTPPLVFEENLHFSLRNAQAKLVKIEERAVVAAKNRNLEGQDGMATCFADLITDHSLSFLCLQETKKKLFSASYVCKMDPYGLFDWRWISSNGKSGGLLSGVRKTKLDIISCTPGKYILHVNVFDVERNCI